MTPPSPPSPPPCPVAARRLARLPSGTLVPFPPVVGVGARSHGGCLWSLDTVLPRDVGPGWDTPTPLGFEARGWLAGRWVCLLCFSG